MTDEWLGFMIVLAVVAFAMAIVSFTRLPRQVKLLVYAALALRVIGALVRYAVLVGFYHGFGDAMEYYRIGLRLAEQLTLFNLGPLFDSSNWRGGVWWGTTFIYFPSALTLSLIGPSVIGEFVVFSLFSFLGLVGFGIAFHRAYPAVPVARYLRWIWVLPSLWFWTSSIGKEAIVLLGIGLTFLGFAGSKQRIHWLTLAAGVGLVFAVRPQVAAVCVLSIIIAQWLTSLRKWSVASIGQGLVLLIGGLAVISLSGTFVGLESFDAEGVQTYIVEDPARRIDEGTRVDPVAVGIAGTPMALLNVLFRPLPWEATNIMVLFSSLEGAALWTLIWLRRKHLGRVLRHWRSDRLVGMALSFIVMYAVALGLIISNLGIIARQRVFIFPFLFLLIEATPWQRALARVPRRMSMPAGRIPQVIPAR